MKNHRIFFISIIGSGFAFLLFLSSIIFSFILFKKSERFFQNDLFEDEGMRYKFYKLDPRSKKVYLGVVESPEHMDEEQFEYYKDNEGNHILISNFETHEYGCYGFCVCEQDEYNNNNNLDGRRGTGELLLKRSSFFLVAAVTSLAAYTKGREYLEGECHGSFHESCSSIRSEVEVCKLAEQLDLFADYLDVEEEEDEDEDGKNKEKPPEYDLPPLDTYEELGSSPSTDKKTKTKTKAKTKTKTKQDEKEKAREKRLEEMEEKWGKMDKKKKKKLKKWMKDSDWEPDPQVWRKWWCEGSCERRKVLKHHLAVEKSREFECEKYSTKGEVWVDEYGVGESKPIEIASFQAIARFSRTVLEDFCKSESEEYILFEAPDGSVKEITEYLCTGSNSNPDDPYFPPSIKCRKLAYYENPEADNFQGKDVENIEDAELVDDLPTDMPEEGFFDPPQPEEEEYVREKKTKVEDEGESMDKFDELLESMGGQEKNVPEFDSDDFLDSDDDDEVPF